MKLTGEKYNKMRDISTYINQDKISCIYFLFIIENLKHSDIGFSRVPFFNDL